MTGELIVAPATTPRVALATDQVLLEHTRRTGRPALHVFTCGGDVVSLGRYHVAPPTGVGDVVVTRRRSGGRVAAAGAGFVGVSLALPHRGTLAGGDAGTISASQVPNRCVRGILGAWEAAGVTAFYPGRDVITVGGRTAGVVSFDEGDDGACLFEAILAIGRDASVLPFLLERADPEGVVQAAMVVPEEVTSLLRERGKAPELDQVVAWLCAGYAERSGLVLARGALDDHEQDAVRVAAETDFGDARWLRARTPRRDLTRRARAATQLGAFEAQFSCVGDRLAEVRLVGDLIADSGGFARLEASLRGLPAECEPVAAAVRRHLADPRHFLLGLGADPGRVIGEAIARGACR